MEIKKTERIKKMMTADSDEYDICGVIGCIFSDDDCDIAANLLYFDLNDVELCNFFNKAGEFMLNMLKSENSEDLQKYHKFQRTFNLIKYKMNEILKKRLGTQDDLLVVSIPDFSGNTYTYTVDLTDMTIYHMNSSGHYILNYEADTKAIEYLFTTDPDSGIHVRCKCSSPNYIYVSRVLTPIHTFVLRKI
jgi:hypothetical protein